MRLMFVTVFTLVVSLSLFSTASAQKQLIANQSLQPTRDSKGVPAGFKIVGDAVYGDLSQQAREHSGWGVRLLSAVDHNRDKASAGSVQTTVSGITADQGRWYIKIRVAPSDG